MSTPQPEFVIRGGSIARRTGIVTFARTPQVSAGFLAAVGSRPIEVVVRMVRRVRSPKANSAYWTCVIRPWAADIGDTENGLHEALKLEILGLENPDGGRLPRVRSTRGMSPEAFTDFVEQAMAIGARMGQVFEFPQGRPALFYPPEAA